MFYREKMWDYIKRYGVAIAIKTNLFLVKFLDIKFNLLHSTFKPYRKPNKDLICVHNDPP